MAKAKISYEAAYELAALVKILAPYALKGCRADKKGKYNRVYIDLDPEKLRLVAQGITEKSHL